MWTNVITQQLPRNKLSLNRIQKQIKLGNNITILHRKWLTPDNKKRSTKKYYFWKILYFCYLVLLEPAGQVVGDGSGVVNDGKVSVLVRLRDRLHEVVRLAQVVGLQLVLERLVRGFREKGFFLKDGKKSHRFFEQVDASLSFRSRTFNLFI